MLCGQPVSARFTSFIIDSHSKNNGKAHKEVSVRVIVSLPINQFGWLEIPFQTDENANQSQMPWVYIRGTI